LGHATDPRDVIGHMTIRLPLVDFLWVIHGDNASIWHCYGYMAPQMLNARTWTLKERRRKREKGRQMGRKGKGKVKGKRKRKER